MYLSAASKLQLPQLNRTESTGPIVLIYQSIKSTKLNFILPGNVVTKVRGNIGKFILTIETL